MKKFKLFNILLILVLVLVMPVVHAHDITLSTDITIPEKISASTKIEVNEDFGEYELYYQWVAMDAEDYETYSDYLEQQLALEVPGNDATDAEIKEYKEEVAEYEKSKVALKPGYDDEKWAKSNNGTVPFNLETEGVEEGDPYVLWVKAVSTEDDSKVIYNERLIPYAIPEENVESPETNDNVAIITVLTVAAAGLMVVSYKKSRA